MYDKFFYRNQVENSYSSAEIFAKFIATIFKPKSVVDVGCGKGVWLKAFDEQFQCDTVGVEGKWLKREELVYKPSIFLNKDLNAKLKIDGKFDLLLSMEVAEHLNPDMSKCFINELCSLSDFIIFSAAVPYQGGIYHTNEDSPSSWAIKFQDNGFICYDIFRERFAANRDVALWYRQNASLYVREGSKSHDLLTHNGYKALTNYYFLDLVDLDLYMKRIKPAGYIKYWIAKILPSKLVALLHGIFK
jgi:hypothetical protein